MVFKIDPGASAADLQNTQEFLRQICWSMTVADDGTIVTMAGPPEGQGHGHGTPDGSPGGDVNVYLDLSGEAIKLDWEHVDERNRRLEPEQPKVPRMPLYAGPPTIEPKPEPKPEPKHEPTPPPRGDDDIEDIEGRSIGDHLRGWF